MVSFNTLAARKVRDALENTHYLDFNLYYLDPSLPTPTSSLLYYPLAMP